MNNYRFTRHLFGVLALFMLSCASLSENECQSGNWRAIGYRDGTMGRLPTYFAQHANACAQFNLMLDGVNRANWEQGREHGLKQYCTPQNAYRIGQSGKVLAPVCSEQQQSSLYQAHQQGINYHNIDKEVRRVQKQRKQYQRELQKILSTPQNENIKYRVAYLQQQITELNYRIKSLRRQRQQLRAYF